MNKLIILAGSLGLAVSGLILKNYFYEKSVKSLSKEEVLRILRIIRKQNYPFLKKISVIVVQMGEQFKKNLSQQMLEVFLNGPESGINMKAELEQITDRVCENMNTDSTILARSIEELGQDTDLSRMMEHIDRDYQQSLQGKTPHFEAPVPAFLTKEKIIDLLDKSAKRNYLFQTKMYQKIKDLSMEELNSNPELAKQIGSPDDEILKVLQQEGLGSEYVPAQAMLEAGIKHYASDMQFKREMMAVEQGYSKIFRKYAYKMQTKMITELEISKLEEEIIFHNAK